MKAGNLLFSAVQFVFVVLVILLGGFFIGFQHAPHLRFLVSHFFSDPTVSFSLIGYFILGCGVFLLIGFCVMHGGIYYRVKMKGGDLLVDPVVIRSYVDEYWKNAFPDHDLSVEVSVSNQALEMFVELPLLSEENQEAFLEKAEVELAQILQKRLGYYKEFSLSVLVK